MSVSNLINLLISFIFFNVITEKGLLQSIPNIFDSRFFEWYQIEAIIYPCNKSEENALKMLEIPKEI